MIPGLKKHACPVNEEDHVYSAPSLGWAQEKEGDHPGDSPVPHPPAIVQHVHDCVRLPSDRLLRGSQLVLGELEPALWGQTVLG